MRCMARVGWAGGGREAERGAGYGRLRLARAGYVHLRRGAARLARRSGLTSNQSLLPANVSCCHTKGASFRSAGERRQGGGEWRPTMTGFCTNYGPWNRGYGPQRGFPRQTPPHLSRLICTSWNELERAGQIRPNRVVCGKHYRRVSRVLSEAFSTDLNSGLPRDLLTDLTDLQTRRLSSVDFFRPSLRAHASSASSLFSISSRLRLRS